MGLHILKLLARSACAWVTRTWIAIAGTLIAHTRMYNFTKIAFRYYYATTTIVMLIMSMLMISSAKLDVSSLNCSKPLVKRTLYSDNTPKFLELFIRLLKERR